jgi:methanogenic corrinoid protein MtbC1
LLARRPLAAPESGGLLTPPPPLTRQVEPFVGLVLGNELPEVNGFVSDLCGAGASVESLYLDLLTPAARQLGDMWKRDEVDFTQVTVGLWRLHQVLRELGPSFHGDADLRAAGPRALLMPVPGEQHTFGLAMVVDFFRRDGWAVWSGALETNAELATMVRHQAFAVVGFSVACGDRLEQLADVIRRVRRASCNPHVGVMVGGPTFVEQPHLAAAVGADATATDGRQAVQQARTWLSLLDGRR